MAVLVTGIAGFIGYHTGLALLKRGDEVIGVDNLNDYYDVSLKTARLKRLKKYTSLRFIEADVADKNAMMSLAEEHPHINQIVHLAAQAGVRYSLVNPYAYTHANVEGQLVVLELCRKLRDLKHVVYASSSSVYGTNEKLPFSIFDKTETPVSLYAATKKATELMAHSYSHMFDLPLTGLRFFTVYGPWGRPDMSAFIFIRKIISGEPIPVFNSGNMARDFTYIDDIVDGILACMDHPPTSSWEGAPYRIYNIGNNKSEPLMRFISLIEKALGMEAEIEFLPMQSGDVQETFADIEATTRDFGFLPKVSIDQGVPRLVEWYHGFYGNK